MEKAEDFFSQKIRANVRMITPVEYANARTDENNEGG